MSWWKRIGAHDINKLGGHVTSVLQAMYEADHVIMHWLLEKKIIIAETRDADIPVMTGDPHFCIKGSSTIVNASKGTILTLMQFLPDYSKAELKPTKVNVMENVKSMNLRFLFMLPLVYDAWVGGMKSWGLTRLRNDTKSEE